MPVYLCKEGIEEFSMEARDILEAIESAAMFNAVVIKEIKNVNL